MNQEKLLAKAAKRFLSHINKTDTCWLWTGVKHNIYGYGQFSVGYKQYRAHRYAYQTMVGEIPAGMDVCHSCDIRSCVNPSHLWLGMQKDNMADMAEKGRRPCGSASHLAKLSEKDVCQIKSLVSAGLTHQNVADNFGVGRPCITKIVNGLRWKQLA